MKTKKFDIDFKKYPLCEYEICMHCLYLGKSAEQSVHLHQDIARSPIDSELICLSCFDIQKKPYYNAPKLLKRQKEKISLIIDEFYSQRQRSLNNLEDF